MCKCILCGQKCGFTEDFESGKCHYVCENCGRYFASREFAEDIEGRHDISRTLLSGYTRELYELGVSEPYISNDNVLDILKSPLIPAQLTQKVDKLLLYYYRNTHSFGELIPTTAAPATCYASTSAEIESIYDYLIEENFLERQLAGQSIFANPHAIHDKTKITFNGFEYGEKIMKESIPSNIGFVAMWFSTEMDDVYECAIKPAIEHKSCGDLRAFRVDNKEHNNDITDEIIAGIKESRFVVADMTGYRGGVYYEAGFAKGLSKPVIFTCRKDWFEGEKDEAGKIIKEKIHFDVNHQNIIVWNDKDELRQRLINRIRATII